MDKIVEKPRILRSLAVLLCLLSCMKDKPDPLIGHWTAFEVLEEGEALDINAAEIQLGFQEGNTYHYESTLAYKEAGRYHVEHQYLYTTDTSHTTATAKAVEILQLTTDTLQLRMNDQGKERILKLVKLQQDTSSGFN